MGTLLIILGVLFLTLVILVPLWEKYAAKGDQKGRSPKDYSHLARYIFPLIALLIVLQILNYYFF
ncbi:hypothetical protein RE428_11660 [Marinobacter nanhaiticus D15-8W]|uniref:Uncharacterized protein n=1 Tax=Marinobacter nanhaiticus D15-8W TaxID=626887 RepID=N6VRJ2_9GAMM|nr:hypothetical protein [Marinobacter nanhaiticus]ENO12800.1 hypothetical protein J057_15420 [Marinobacter nanhaiticus D15-8W]BES70148.1 hypothetical protein RE428_11660 [Marinobacter nanhaiticus D15-8W]